MSIDSAAMPLESVDSIYTTNYSIYYYCIYDYKRRKGEERFRIT